MGDVFTILIRPIFFSLSNEVSVIGGNMPSLFALSVYNLITSYDYKNQKQFSAEIIYTRWSYIKCRLTISLSLIYLIYLHLA